MSDEEKQPIDTQIPHQIMSCFVPYVEMDGFFFYCRVIDTLQEPLGEWQNVNGTGLNMLEAFYKDPKRSLISTFLPSGNP